MWRRVRVPADYSFDELSVAIMEVFVCTTGYHLHGYSVQPIGEKSHEFIATGPPNLGVAIDVAAATSHLADENGNHSVPTSEFASRFIAKIEESIGSLTYHTDDHGHGLSCAGCGYCNASLVEPDNFFVPQAFAESFAEHLPQVDEKLAQEQIPVAVYTGGHDEQAVIMPWIRAYPSRHVSARTLAHTS